MSGKEVVAELKNVSVTYKSDHKEVKALDNLSLYFSKSTSTAVVGRSGCGKSTLVSVLSLLRTPSSGQVLLAGRDTRKLSARGLANLRAREIGIVFQSFHLEPSLDALNNIALSWRFGRTGYGPRTAKKRARNLMEALGIGELERRHPNSMSGGQRQRVAIARALFSDPLLFVADEPTGNLDEETANAVSDTLFKLPGEFATAVVIVTHDREVAGKADRIIELSKGKLTESSKS